MTDFCQVARRAGGGGQGFQSFRFAGMVSALSPGRPRDFDAPEPSLGTLNRTEAIDPAHVVKRLTYRHPLYTPAGVAAQGRHREVNGPLRTYYCGAYWRNGFHEDGVASALQALAHFREDHAQRPVYRLA